MIFYHIDRDKKLRPGITLELLGYNYFFPKDNENLTIKRTFEKAFPDGISWHGDGYFLADEAKIYLFPHDNGRAIVDYSQMIDVIFELIRKSYFPDKPSRWQSFFALKTMKQAKKFIKTMKWNSDSPIWEVECESFHKVDMNLLKADGKNIDIYTRAFAYWGGEKLDDLNPSWEYLLPYPVKIIKKVN